MEENDWRSLLGRFETHLVAEKLWMPQVHVAPKETKSRDFH